MNIALDYDETYTRDPLFWDGFCRNAKTHGHTVYCVTMRYREESGGMESIASVVHSVFFTGRKAKQKYMYDKGIRIDVWIDDSPHFIVMDALA